VTAETPHQKQQLAQIDSLRVHYQALAALAEIDAILPDARAMADSSFLLELLIRKGELRSSFGQVQASVLILNEAIGLAEALGDSFHLCEGLRWLGVAKDALGHVEEAHRLYKRQLEVAEALGSPGHQGWALVGLAWRDFVNGYSSGSARRYRQAITHFQADIDWRGEPWAWNAPTFCR